MWWGPFGASWLLSVLSLWLQTPLEIITPIYSLGFISRRTEAEIKNKETKRQSPPWKRSSEGGNDAKTASEWPHPPPASSPSTTSATSFIQSPL
jgi:hypothetical protein